jgi:hypothetical protein
MTTTRSLSILLLSLALAAAAARAEEPPRMPVPFVERPLTLPSLTLAPGIGVSVFHNELVVPVISLFLPGAGPSSFTGVGMDIGAAFGITDNLQVSADVVPLSLYPDVRYGSAQVGMRYRFLRGPVELGIDAALDFPPPHADTFVLQVGVPARFHLGHWGRIDSGIQFATPLVSQSDAMMTIPLDFTVQAGRSAFVGVASGVVLPTLKGDVGTNTIIPLGFLVGGTVPGQRGPLVDIAATFAFPMFATPGFPSGSDKVHALPYTVGLTGTFYIYI